MSVSHVQRSDLVIHIYIFFFFYLVYYSILNVVPHKPQPLSTVGSHKLWASLSAWPPRNQPCLLLWPAHLAVMQAPLSLWPSHCWLTFGGLHPQSLPIISPGTRGAHVLRPELCLSQPGPVLPAVDTAGNTGPDSTGGLWAAPGLVLFLKVNPQRKASK